MKIEYTQIGVINSPFKELPNMPIQPAKAAGVQGSVEVFEEFRPGLQDLGGFSHIILLYCFHRSKGYKLQVVPFMDTQPRGVFSTRSPKRPNPLGLSVVRLLRIENEMLYIMNVDILDGTPLIDIKPYVPEFDVQTNIRTGWLEQVKKTVSKSRSENQFE